MEIKVKSKKAFTLIELLVVISIITALMAILVPSLRRAKGLAQTILCGSRQRQLQIGYRLYVENYEKLIPYVPRRIWIETLTPYLADVDTMRFCPSAPKVMFESDWLQSGRTDFIHGSAKSAWRWKVDDDYSEEGSFGMNGFLYNTEPGYNPGGHLFVPQLPFPQAWWGSLDKVTNPYDVPVFGDCIWTSAWPIETAHVPTDITFGSNAGLARFCMDRHNMKVNLVFVDGHVAATPLEELWKKKWSKIFEPTEVKITR